MLNSSNIPPNVLNSAANLGSDSLLTQTNALSQLAFLSGSSDTFQNGTVFSSSSSSGPLYLGEGIPIVTTGAGNDRIYVGSSNDQIFAGGGNNSLFLGEEFNVVTGAGNDTVVYGGATSDIVNAGKGNNTLYLGEGVNIAITGLGDDLINPGAAIDVIKAGDDLLATRKGAQLSSDNGTDLSYIDIATGLWNSGYSTDTRELADLLQNKGATETEISQAIAGVLQSKGIAATEIAQILKTDFGATLGQIANALDDGTDFSYTDIAKALWEVGTYKSSPKYLTAFLQNEGATATEIAQALKDGFNFSPAMVVDALINFSYTDTAIALWNSGYLISPRELASALKIYGATPIEITRAVASALRSKGATVTEITTALITALKSDIKVTSAKIVELLGENTTFSYTDIAKGLWEFEKTDPQSLARVLRNGGVTAKEIAQALKDGFNFSIETIADALYDGATFNYTDVASGLWNSGYAISLTTLVDLIQRKGATQTEVFQAIAGALQSKGGTATEIAQTLNSGFRATLEQIANALDDGATFDYTDIAEGLYFSGETYVDSQIIARVLQNEGATAKEIAQAFNNALGFSLESITNGLDDGATTFDYTSIAYAVWNSGKTGFNSLDLARVLQNEGATATEIAQAFNYGLGFSLEIITSSLDNGTTFNYTDIAKGLWNSGLPLDAPTLAKVLQDKGATARETAQALYSGIGGTLDQITDALDDGATFSYTDITKGIASLPIPFNSLDVARVLQKEKATAAEIAQAFNYGLGYDLDQITYALDKGTDFTYTDIAYALWNSGKTEYSTGQAFNSRILAYLLEQRGATATQIAQALNYGAKFDLATIADALDNGTRFSYTDIAKGLGNSGKNPTTRTLASVLKNEGATATEIAMAFNNGFGFNLETIADALDDGAKFNYTNVAKGLWDSGKAISSTKLAGLLRNEGANETQIARALNYGLGFNLEDIAYALDDGAKFNYTNVAKGLWDSGKAISSTKLAGLLRNEGANETQIARALNYGLGFNLEDIAYALDDGAKFNYTNVAKGLWDSGLAVSSRDIAAVLWRNVGAPQGEIGKALAAIGLDYTAIADAMDDGVPELNYVDVAIGVWESGVLSPRTAYRLGKVLRGEGASIPEAVDALQGVGFSYAKASKEVISGVIKDLYDDAKRLVRSAGQKLDNIYSDAKENVAREIKPITERIDQITPPVFDSVLRGSLELATNPRKFVDEVSNAADYVQNSLDKSWSAISQASDYVGNKLPKDVNDLKALGKDLDGFLANSPAGKLANDLAGKLKSGLDAVDVNSVIGVLKRIPVLGTAVSGLEGLVNLAKGDWKGVLKSAIDGALAFYGASNVVTPRLVSLFVDVSWELKVPNYKGAVSAALSNFGVERRVSDTFVNTAWAMKDGDWRSVLDAGLSSAGFNNARQFVDMAWGAIDNKPADVLNAAFGVAGLDKLDVDQAKANAFVQSAVALKENKVSQVADQLLSVAGTQASQLANSAWVQALKDSDPNNDRTALSQGLSAVGFKKVNDWVDMAWAVKDQKYLQAASTAFSLTNFAQGRDWVNMAENIQKQNYLDALSTGFKVAGFAKGESLAKAAIALRDKQPLNAFIEGLSLVDGVSELGDAFKALKDGNAKVGVPLMIKAAPKLALLIGT
ncbi:hypothetical protein [Microcoleus sp. POL10_C6]|uniref:hypothetical protein n=1 Tax=Microcoleus sp. POL10_C6 TaxID=2818852 RepID=UPI002FCFB2A9